MSQSYAGRHSLECTTLAVATTLQDCCFQKHPALELLPATIGYKCLYPSSMLHRALVWRGSSHGLAVWCDCSNHTAPHLPHLSAVGGRLLCDVPTCLVVARPFPPLPSHPSDGNQTVAVVVMAMAQCKRTTEHQSPASIRQLKLPCGRHNLSTSRLGIVTSAHSASLVQHATHDARVWVARTPPSSHPRRMHVALTMA